MDAYFNLLSKRASGELPTTATWLRGLVNAHPLYKHGTFVLPCCIIETSLPSVDSVVSEEIAYDICRHVDLVGRGEVHDETLLGPKPV